MTDQAEDHRGHRAELSLHPLCEVLTELHLLDPRECVLSYSVSGQVLDACGLLA